MNLLKGGLALHESFRNSVDIERHPRLQEVIGHQTFATVTNLLPLSREMYFFLCCYWKLVFISEEGVRFVGLKTSPLLLTKLSPRSRVSCHVTLRYDVAPLPHGELAGRLAKHVYVSRKETKLPKRRKQISTALACVKGGGGLYTGYHCTRMRGLVFIVASNNDFWSLILDQRIMIH